MVLAFPDTRLIVCAVIVVVSLIGIIITWRSCKAWKDPLPKNPSKEAFKRYTRKKPRLKGLE